MCIAPIRKPQPMVRLDASAEELTPPMAKIDGFTRRGNQPEGMALHPLPIIEQMKNTKRGK